MTQMRTHLHEKLRAVRLIVTDVDGVLTDGSFYIGPDTEMKRFHASDGLAFVLLRLIEFPVAVISGRYSRATLARTRALQIPDDLVFQSDYTKIKAYEDLKVRFELEDRHIAYIGDDYIDEPVLKRCGISFAPANAIPEIKNIVDYVTKTPGGSGAFREITDKILHAQDLMANALGKLQGLYK
ncbi:MAG: HAD hydrolase family protein [Candidatus Marinimicrobia bacterium]|nr:HAD hydrolase family protein [Candidatus Neomarinimicrobiota bacterium]